jgi:toxin ParE1/3/4
MPSFELSPWADADLDEIFEYTAQTWGAGQAYKYLLELSECAEALALGSVHFKNLNNVRSGLRMVRCQHHYIYCVPRTYAPALIVAILHESMDLMARIAKRLT